MTLSLPFATQDLQFPFSYLRMGQQGYNGPGVVLSGDMVVSPGSGLQVQIAAGEANVQQTVARLGAFYASRGIYYIFNDSVGAPYNTITAPITYPRVDQVIARVYDSYEQQLTGNSYWRFEWLTGTETDGATLENLDGAASLPDNSLRLAYGLATVAMSSWSSSNISNVTTIATVPRYALRAYMSGTGAGMPAGEATALNTVGFVAGTAVASDFDTSTYKWTCPVAGVYAFSWAVGGNLPTVSDNNFFASLYHNSSEASRGVTYQQSDVAAVSRGSDIINCAAGDTVYNLCYSSAGGYYIGGTYQNFLSIHRAA